MERATFSDYLGNSIALVTVAGLIGGVMWLVSELQSDVEVRERIVLKQPVKAVEARIRTMNLFLDRFPVVKGQVVNSYFDHQGDYHVSGHNLGRFNLDTISLFKAFTPQERKAFLSTVIFLNDNYLSSVYRESMCECYLYNYRSLNDGEYYSARYIYLKQDTGRYTPLLIERSILDTRGSLVLIGQK